ncbi:unnamed protein product [Heligmosomoides polygyrus]|uniref:Uncharacterized protein n=1 Tax=Heligmosomoides polygyrus TaxID=6339 RepID=A0A183G4F9_HELPZ|nr:unnamed protein product [Heligmosomoides polygyrus]
MENPTQTMIRRRNGISVKARASPESDAQNPVRNLCCSFYIGEDNNSTEVGIAVAESLKVSVAAVQRINVRIMSLRLDTKSYWTIMSVYALQTGCTEHDKDGISRSSGP